MSIKTIFLITMGSIFLVLGAIGVVLPVMPTTPFVLLAVACFSSEPRLKSKIMRIPFVKEHLENYQNRTGIPCKTLIINLAFLWGMLILSCVIVKKIWLTVFLLAIGTGVTTHLVYMSKPKNTITKKNNSKRKSRYER